MENGFINLFGSMVGAVLSGVAVFFLGELWKERVLDPIHSFKLLRGRILAALVFHMKKYTVLLSEREIDGKQTEIYHEISQELRALASELVSTTSLLPKHRQKLPHNKEIIEATSQLIGLSNNIPCVVRDDENMCRENREHEEEIRKLLGLQNKK